MQGIFTMSQRGGQIFRVPMSELAQCSSFAEWSRRFGRTVSAAPKPAGANPAQPKEIAELNAERERLERENEELRNVLRQRAARNSFSAATPTYPNTPAARAGLAGRLRFAGGFNAFKAMRHHQG